MMIEEIEGNIVGSKEPKGSKKMGQGSSSVKRNMFGRRTSDRFHIYRVLTILGLAFAMTALSLAVVIFLSFEARLILLEGISAPTYQQISVNMQTQREQIDLVNARLDKLEKANSNRK